MEQLINITDAVFLGHVGEIELGASAIAGIYYLAIYMLGFGFSIGLQVMVARRNGEQDYKETGKTFFQGLFFLLGLAIFLYLLIHTVSPFILKKLIVSSDIYRAVILYLDWRSFFIPIFFLFLSVDFTDLILTQSVKVSRQSFRKGFEMSFVFIFRRQVNTNKFSSFCCASFFK